MSIQYNSLNLPTVIEFADGKTIKYTYSADGHKLRAVYTTTMPATSKTVDYCGNLIFENGQLKQMLVDGGYIPMDDWSGTYRFYVKDHLGNNRVVVHTSGEVEQVNHYYPYGGLMAESTNWNTQWYKYNGKARASESRESMYALLCRVQPRLDTVKELDHIHGLDWYDYGARWQDAAIGGRWHAMDPLCEMYYDVSPYVYCVNNPVKFVDPDGRDNYTLNRDGTLELLQRTVSKTTDSYETGKGHKDIVATSHDGNYVDVYNNEGKELGGMDLLDLASRTHSHVDGDKKPSGWNPSDSYKDNKGNVYMIESDRRTALNISNKFKESNKTPPRFYMYHVPSKSTIRYDGNKVYY